MTARLLLLLSLVTGGCALSVKGELPEIEVTQHDITIPGVPREVRNGEPTVALPSFFQPNNHLGLDPGSYRSVKVKDVSVTLKKGGGGDMTFVRSLDITINGLQGYLAGLAPAEAAHYDRVAGGPVGTTITARNATPVEVGDAWRDSLTVMTIQASGDLPDEPWTIDVTVHLSAVLSY